VTRPSPGATAFGVDTAGWLDADHKSLRALRVLAQVRLPESVVRDGQGGRPLLPPSPRPAQQSGTPIDGLPSVALGLLYWHTESGEWRRSNLLRPTLHEAWPLQPFERDVVARLPDRNRAYVVLQAHFYRPPVLDDARDVFLAFAETWRGELLAGRVIAWPAHPGRLLPDARPRRPIPSAQARRGAH
jgi:hypothetical protein